MIAAKGRLIRGLQLVAFQDLPVVQLGSAVAIVPLFRQTTVELGGPSADVAEASVHGVHRVIVFDVRFRVVGFHAVWHALVRCGLVVGPAVLVPKGLQGLLRSAAIGVACLFRPAGPCFSLDGHVVQLIIAFCQSITCPIDLRLALVVVCEGRVDHALHALTDALEDLALHVGELLGPVDDGDCEFLQRPESVLQTDIALYLSMRWGAVVYNSCVL
mmetsp:Transcript_65797/g.165848  ORF Transcript_65797/g.165848 Transcript_65797/m.165848 type:complete len:216 (-) Transcript_65797:280-927(-)